MGTTTMDSLGSVLKVAVIAGLLAGAAVAGFHALLIEPVLDRAIALEEHLSQARGEVAHEPVIDRPTQRWGMVLGFLLYGAIWGLLLGVAFYLTRAWQPLTWTITRRGLLLGLLAGWSVAMFPFLKYPANPPGVGDAATIGYRQALYFGFIGLSVVGTALAIGLYRLLRAVPWSSALARGRGWLASGFYMLYAAAVYVMMPANPDPVAMPAQLVWTFRAISFAGLIVFWMALGGAFGWFARDEGGS